MRLRSVAIPPPVAVSDVDPAAVASAIGERLTRSAVWYRAQCNWIGPQAGGRRALGPALGDGTAGVALLLAHLPGAPARRTAAGAIGQALAHASELPAPGLYGGRLGVAYAAARCATLLGDDRLFARAARLARARHPQDADFDLHAGTAGAITALLALARLLDDDRLAARAAGLGDELIAGARRARHGWSWPAAGAPVDHGLCGLAHGASGAALAFAELFAITGDARYSDGAERALDYERSWFHHAAGDWPDLRGVRRSEQRASIRALQTTTWAHGAPGIALARLRVHAVLGGERHRDEAVTALTRTAAHLDQTLRDHAADFSLGAGLAGSADVLLLGGDLHPDGAQLARRAGEVAAGRYAGTVDGWPCERSPTLLGGHAGIGLLYLRLHDGALPSPLLVE